MASFEAMAGLPVTIRLLDPPLHEFLPNYTEAMVELERLRLTGAPAEAIAAQEMLIAKVKSLSEANPMLGTRGCRLGIQWPEIYAMQVRAIIEAAADVLAATGEMPHVEIMIPLVGFEEELEADAGPHRGDRRRGAQGARASRSTTRSAR